MPRGAPITTSNCGDKTERWSTSRVDGERSPVARRLNVSAWNTRCPVHGIAHERAHKVHGGNTTVARKRTGAVQRLRIVLRGRARRR